MARHSVAKYAQSKGLNQGEIQMMLRHSKSSTTDAYLKSLEVEFSNPYREDALFILKSSGITFTDIEFIVRDITQIAMTCGVEKVNNSLTGKNKIEALDDLSNFTLELKRNGHSEPVNSWRGIEMILLLRNYTSLNSGYKTLSEKETLYRFYSLVDEMLILEPGYSKSKFSKRDLILGELAHLYKFRKEALRYRGWYFTKKSKFS